MVTAAAPQPRAGTGEGWRGETYYDKPAVKHSHWGWKVGTYIFLGGMAGAAQVIAALAREPGRAAGSGLRADAHLLGTAGAAAGAALLIADLKTPHRFYNMLRIFRPTSPMSIGSYILTGFGLASGLGALGTLLGSRLQGRAGGLARRLAQKAQLPAAIAGAGMSTYTAALLSSTSTPYWAAAPRLMGSRFGSSAMASGAAALSLGARLRQEEETAEALDCVALLASGVSLLCSLAAEARTRKAGVRPGLGETATGTGLLGLAEGLPVLGYALASASPRMGADLSVLSSLAVLAGGLLMRNDIIRAGNRSADRPRDYFRLAQPRNLPKVTSGRRSAPRASRQMEANP